MKRKAKRWAALIVGAITWASSAPGESPPAGWDPEQWPAPRSPVERFGRCMQGPRFEYPLYYECDQWDANEDGRIDLFDLAEWWAGG